MTLQTAKKLLVGFLLITHAVHTRASDSEFRQVVDLTGRTVAIPANPKHVLSLCTSVTDTMLRLGAVERLAGIDEYSLVVPGATNIAVLGKGSALSREQILNRRIDLAFIWWFQDDAAQTLADLRVPTVKIRCERASEIPAMIHLVGGCVCATNQADQLAAKVASQIEALRQAPTTNAPRVFAELYSPFKTAGRNSYLDDLIGLAGGRNVASDTDGPILLSAERLLQSDPEVVLLIAGFASPESFARRNGTDALAAVKAGRVYSINRYCLVAGAGLPEGVAKLRRLFDNNTQTKP